MDWIIEIFRNNPSIPIFLTLGVGFWIGKLKYKTFSLGTVTSVLLVGVLVGQMNIPIPGPVKSVFFLLFLFAIGYSVGPQFFQAMKGTGIKQVIFAVVMCAMCFGVTVGVALLFGYNPGEAAGLFAGSQTISAVIGVGDDTISTLSAAAADKKNWTDLVPVCYAVTYIFGTIGSAYILAYVGPMLLGGLKKVKLQTAELERTLNQSSLSNDPAYIDALRPVAFRAYEADGDFFSQSRTVAEIEQEAARLGRRLFIDRARVAGKIVDSPSDSLVIAKGDAIVVSGRREFVVKDESWLGPEVADSELLSFAVEKIPVMIAAKDCDGITVDALRRMPAMTGVAIAKITRGGQSIPVLANTELHRSDVVTIAGLKQEVDAAAKVIGFADRPSKATDMVFVGLGIFIGALIGAITIHLGGIPVSLSTSGGRPHLGPCARLAAFAPTHFRRHPRLVGMADEQPGPQYVYRCHRHHRRAHIRERHQGSRLDAVCGRYNLHHGAAAVRRDYRRQNLQVSPGYQPRMLRRLPHHYGCSRRHSGLS